MSKQKTLRPPQVQSFELEVPVDCEEIQIIISKEN